MKPKIPDNEIISGNLRETAARRDKLERLMLLESFEILNNIKPLLKSGTGAARAAGIAYSEFRKSGCSAFLGISERVDICRRLCRMMLQSGISPAGLLVPSAPDGGISKIGYVSNNFTEEAFSAFAASYPGSDAKVYNSFSDMCEDTGSGGCCACILPVENTADGKLPGFYSLIDRFDLKITLQCDIFSDDDSRRTRYALLRRALVLPPGDEDDLYLEISFTNQQPAEAHEIFYAAGLFGLKLYRADSLPLRYSETSFIINPIFRGSFEDIQNFAVYLGFIRLQYTPVGLSRLILTV